LLDEYHEQKQALSKYCIGALLLTDSVLGVLRRELRRLSPDVKIDTDEIKSVLSHEVIKREVLEDDKAAEASRRINRASNRALRTRSQRTPEVVVNSATVAPTPPAVSPV
jgi:hypothetical protein